MSWWEATPALIAAVLFLVVPGAPIALATGARGISWLAVSVAASVSAIAVAAVLAPIAGLRWEPYTPFLLSVPLAIIAWSLRRTWRRRIPSRHAPSSWRADFGAAVIGVAIGATLISYSIAVGIPHPDWPSQTYDEIFHLNAVQQILQTGNGSTFSLNVSAPNSRFVFYPAAWHDLAALVSTSSGASIVVAANATSSVIAAFVWPLGCVFLVRQLFGAQKFGYVLAGVLSAAFSAFPLLLLQFGVLYPNLLGFALLPIALGILVMSLGLSPNAELEWPGRWLLFFWTVAGLGFAHPNAVFGLMVLALPPVTFGLVTHLRRLRSSRQPKVRSLAVIALALLAAVICAIAWLKSGTSDNGWQPYQTVAQAIGESVLNGPELRPPALVLTALMLLGVVVALRSKRGWLVLSYVFSVVLFVVASSPLAGSLRTAITGLWYNDSFRLAAMLPVAALPLATLGALRITRRLQAWLRSHPRMTAHRWLPSVRATALLIPVVLVLATQGASVRAEREALAQSYHLSAEAPLLTPDEIAMFDVVRTSTPTDAVIAGNPWDGSGLVYAYTGRKALFPHVGGSYEDDRWAIAEHLDDDAAAICSAIRHEDVQYVLDFGNRYLFGADPRSRKYPGFDDLASSGAVRLVAHKGDAKLYKVTACGLS